MRVDFKCDYSGSFPDAIKLKKRLNLWPFEVSGTLTWSLESNELQPRLSLKDQFFRGKISVDVAQQSLEYRKRCSIPFLKLPLGAVVGGVRLTRCPTTDEWVPRFRIALELTNAAELTSDLHTLRLKPKVMFMRRVGLQMVGKASVKLPRLLNFEFAQQEDGGMERAEGTLGVKLDVEKLNLVLHL